MSGQSRHTCSVADTSQIRACGKVESGAVPIDSASGQRCVTSIDARMTTLVTAAAPRALNKHGEPSRYELVHPTRAAVHRLTPERCIFLPPHSPTFRLLAALLPPLAMRQYAETSPAIRREEAAHY